MVVGSGWRSVSWWQGWLTVGFFSLDRYSGQARTLAGRAKSAVRVGAVPNFEHLPPIPALVTGEMQLLEGCTGGTQLWLCLPPTTTEE